MLVNDKGEFQGMLSGGCLEGDLAERSKNAIVSGIAEVVTYDLLADDDVFGLGVGCDGVLRILIQPLRAETDYEPFASLVDALERAPYADMALADADSDFGVARIMAPLRLLVLGAGQDAEPLITFAVALGWEVAISDHRSAAIARLASSNAALVECVPVGTQIGGRGPAAIALEIAVEIQAHFSLGSQS